MKINKKEGNNYIIIIIVLAILFAIILGTIIVSIDRGFDFTDEGGFLLSYKNTELYRGGIYNYHIIINKLTGWLNPDILTYRWMSILLTLSSSFILTIGLYKWMRSKLSRDSLFQRYLFLFLFISIGNLMFFFPGILTIYNNTITNFLLHSSAGLILYLFSKNQIKLLRSKICIAILFLLGVLCAVSFFVKFPTGILQILLYLFLFIFYLNELPFKKRLTIIITFIVGIVVGFQLYFLLIQGPQEWYLNFQKEYSILSDHSSALLLRGYAYEFFSLLTFILKNFFWIFIIPLLIILKNYFHWDLIFTKNSFFRNLVIILTSGIFLLQIYHYGFHKSVFASQLWINAYFYIIIITAQVTFLIAFLQNRMTLNKALLQSNLKELLIIFLLIITPLIGAFGTANPIFSNSLIHLATWFAVIAIFSVYLARYINKRIIILVFIILPSLVTASQIIDGNLFNPYYSVFNQNKSNFFAQTENVQEIPGLGNIYVDKKTKKFLLELKQLLHENDYKKGSPIIGFHIPGVIYLMEGISPAVPYFYNKDRDVKAFEKLYVIGKRPVIMLGEKTQIKKEFISTLQTHGINFPEGYVLKGRVFFPNEDSYLKVYFPENY